MERQGVRRRENDARQAERDRQATGSAALTARKLTLQREPRVPRAQPSLVLGAEAFEEVIALAGGALAVLPLAEHGEQDGEGQIGRAAGQVELVADRLE